MGSARGSSAHADIWPKKVDTGLWETGWIVLFGMGIEGLGAPAATGSESNTIYLSISSNLLSRSSKMVLNHNTVSSRNSKWGGNGGVLLINI